MPIWEWAAYFFTSEKHCPLLLSHRNQSHPLLCRIQEPDQKNLSKYVLPATPLCLVLTCCRQKSVVRVKESVYLTFLVVFFFCGLLFIRSLFVRMMWSSAHPYVARSQSTDVSSSNLLSIPRFALPLNILPLHPIFNALSRTITAQLRLPSHWFFAASMNGVHALYHGFTGFNCVHGPMYDVLNNNITQL